MGTQGSGGSGGSGGGTTNQAPTPAGDNVTVTSNLSKIINILANDTDPNGDSLIVTAVTAPLHGSAVLNADSTITYTPVTGYLGGDSFTYTVSDGHGGTATANVAVTVALGHAGVVHHEEVHLEVVGARSTDLIMFWKKERQLKGPFK